jgi:uncharacterized lipoprotein NlpE involved in copper resistance
MIPVWCLAIVFLLLGCSSTSSNQSTFVAAPAPRRQEAPIEPPKTEAKQDATPVQPNKAEIKSAIRASDEARELLDRRRYILDAGSDKDNVH